MQEFGPILSGKPVCLMSIHVSPVLADSGQTLSMEFGSESKIFGEYFGDCFDQLESIP